MLYAFSYQSQDFEMLDSCGRYEIKILLIHASISSYLYIWHYNYHAFGVIPKMLLSTIDSETSLQRWNSRDKKGYKPDKSLLQHISEQCNGDIRYVLCFNGIKFYFYNIFFIFYIVKLYCNYSYIYVVVVVLTPYLEALVVLSVIS